MRLNRQMHAHLRDLKSREVEGALDPGLAVRAPLQIHESPNGLVLLENSAGGWRSRLASFPDPTNLECTANKLSMSDLVDPRFAASAPLLLLTAGLGMAQRLARELAHFAGIFNVILSYDGESCSVRFHRVRQGESWLHADLEEYSEEGVLVFQAGATAAQERLAD